MPRFVQEPVPNVSVLVLSTARRALSNSMLRFFTVRIIIFTFFIVPSMIAETIICAMENLSIPLDRARRAVFGTSIETCGTGFWKNVGGFYSNLVLTSPNV